MNLGVIWGGGRSLSQQRDRRWRFEVALLADGADGADGAVAVDGWGERGGIRTARGRD